MELFDPDGILSPWCNFLQFNSHVQCICWHQPSTTILWQGSATTIKTLRAHGTATLMQRTHRTCRVNYIPTRNSCRREPVRLGPHSTCFRYVFIFYLVFHRSRFSLNVGELQQHRLPRRKQTGTMEDVLSLPDPRTRKEECLHLVTWRGFLQPAIFKNVGKANKQIAAVISSAVNVCDKLCWS